MTFRHRNSRFGLPRLAVGLSIGFLVLSPSGANAGGRGGVLAPPGPCAERRVTAAGSDMSGFSIVGPVGSLFSPVDVAARPAASVRLPPPSPSALIRPGPCDQPGTGCGLTSVPGADVNPPALPGRRP